MATDRKLIIVFGKQKGQVYHLKKELTVGRYSDNNIVFKDTHVSRYHAVFSVKGGRIFVRDLSSNGTLVNYNRIDGIAEIKHGDLISIGVNTIRYVYPPTLVTRDQQDTSSRNIQLDDATRSFSIKGISVNSLAQEDDIRALEEELGKTRMRDRLKAVYRASQLIAEENDPELILEKVLEEAFDLIGTNNGVIFLFNNDTGELEAKHSKTQSKELSVCSSIVKQAFENNEAILAEDAPAIDDAKAAESIRLLNISSVMCVPFVYRDERLGVVYLDRRGGLAFDKADLECLVALANTSALAVHNSRNIEALENVYKEAIETLARVIELRDQYTVGHAGRVSQIAVEIAREMGWAKDDLKWVKIAGLLHDIGKVIIDNTILNKPSLLTEEERDIMQKHPEYGADILRTSSYLRHIVPFCLYHHERYDGKGYPAGLKGAAIPIGARIMAVADVFDAITSERPYQNLRDAEDALIIIEEEAGMQFDPDCVKALRICFDKDLLPEHSRS